MRDSLSGSEMEYSCFVVDFINTCPRIPGNPRLDVRTYLAHATSPLGSPTPLATILSYVHESLFELACYAIGVLGPFGSFAFATLSLGPLLYLHTSPNSLSTFLPRDLFLESSLASFVDWVYHTQGGN